MSQTAIQEGRPWERPFWKPIPAKIPISNRQVDFEEKRSFDTSSCAAS